VTEGPLRICLVAPLPPPYGGVSHWTQMVRQYASHRADVVLSIVDTAPRWRAVDDLRVWKRALGGGTQLVRDLARAFGRLRTRPHALHLTTSGQLAVARDLAVMRIARGLGVPVVYHIRFGRIPELARSRSREWRMLTRAMQRAHTVVAIDASTEQAIREHLPAVNVVRIPNCVDVAPLPHQPAPEGAARTVMFLGWVIPTKGVGELVQAWAHLHPAGWRLRVVGPVSDRYRDELLAMHRPPATEFMGEKPHAEAMQLLAAADIFVLPSYTEGFPNAVLEGMALGKPIAATRVGAIPEMLADGCGVLVEPRDSEGVRRALSDLIADGDLRRALGSRAKERVVRCYSIESVFAQYMSIWREAAVQP
jgi:glycosyltransferase involved in cell wall biosynthesis